MGIVEKLKNIGIAEGKPADILLDSRAQLRLINDYHINTKTDGFTRYRCVITPNDGRRKYRAPVLGHTRESKLPSSSLQLGIFNLLYFEHVVALNPVPRSKPKGSFELHLFKIDEQRFSFVNLVSRYNLNKVYAKFLDLDEESRVDQASFIKAYAAETYKEFLKKEEMSKKALRYASNHLETDDEPQIGYFESTGDISIVEFESLMASRTQELEVIKQQKKEKEELDPWKGSSDADDAEKLNKILS